MKIKKVIRWTFTILGLLCLLTLTTPLSFETIWFRNIIFLFTIGLSFIRSKDIKADHLKITVRWLPLLIFTFLIFLSWLSMADRITGGWRTVWISHRQVNYPNSYIAGQMLDIGGRGYSDRVVKVTPVIPLLIWVSPIDTTKVSEGWIKVDESFSPFNWKY